MRVEVVNQHGRPWEEFDSIRAQALVEGPFSLESEDGIPLCGRVGEHPVRLVAAGWVGREACPPAI
jgi:hypothetical protein